MPSKQDLDTLRRLVLERARILRRPTAQEIAQERKQAQNLARYILNRMETLSMTPEQLAEKIDIEVDFVTVLLDASFPVSELRTRMFQEIAEALQCTVNDLLAAKDSEDDLR